MQVICCNLSQFITSHTSIHGYKYDNFNMKIEILSSSAYKDLSSAQTNRDCAIALFQIARYEDRTIHLIMKILGKDKWYERASYEDYNTPESIQNSFPIENIEDEIRVNYIFRSILGNKIDQLSTEEIIHELKPLFEYVAENYVILSDVYDKDLDNLMGMSTKQNVIILTRDSGEYIGHIYHYYNQHDAAEFIGIRSSLINIGNRMMGNPHVRNVSYYLLDACVRFIKMTNDKINIVRLQFPIGGMGAISRKFGFNDDCEFNVYTDASKVSIKPYKITFYSE